MKFLGAKPPVPPYLHLGSFVMAVPARIAQTGHRLRLIDAEWPKLSVQIPASPQRFCALLKRRDERATDPSYTDESYEVFYTVTDVGQGQSMIDFFY